MRPSYPGIAELSAYVDETHRSGRVDGELLVHLVNEAGRCSFRSAVSLVFEKNITSIAGCMLYGFRPMATLRGLAQFGGVSENVVWFQKNLLADDPQAYRKIRAASLIEVRGKEGAA